VTKQQLDAVSSGLDVKASVHVASTGNLTLAAPGANIDGVAMVAGDRVLLKNQTAPAENGIYVWNGAAVAMTRAADADASAEVTAGMFTFVEEGTANSDSGWVLTTNAPIVLGTTGLVFAQFSGAGQIIDGNGLTKTGNTLDVNVDASSIEINADILRVKAAGITNAMLAGSIDATTKLTGAVPVTNGGTGQATAKAGRETGLGAAGYYSSATHGAGTTITITQATHGLRATRGLLVQVQDEAVAGGAPGSVVEADVAVASNGDVVVTFGAAMSANTYRVTIIG
jgi:phage-related tail fiber protein